MLAYLLGAKERIRALLARGADLMQAQEFLRGFSLVGAVTRELLASRSLVEA